MFMYVVGCVVCALASALQICSMTFCETGQKMHRILSFQIHHGDDQGFESVSKRLCCSFMFTTAFLSIVGGFLLGQYVTEKHILLRGAQQPCTEKEKRTELIDKLSMAAKTLTSTTEELKPHMKRGDSPVAENLFKILQCERVSLTDANRFQANIKQRTNEILSLHLQILTDCLNNATGYIKQEISIGYNASSRRK